MYLRLSLNYLWPLVLWLIIVETSKACLSLCVCSDFFKIYLCALVDDGAVAGHLRNL